MGKIKQFFKKQYTNSLVLVDEHPITTIFLAILLTITLAIQTTIFVNVQRFDNNIDKYAVAQNTYIGNDLEDFKVVNVNTSDNIGGGAIPKGNFVVVRLKYRVHGTDNRRLDTEHFVLKTPFGTYKQKEDNIVIPNNTQLLEDINRNTINDDKGIYKGKAEGFIVFDVPKWQTKGFPLYTKAYQLEYRGRIINKYNFKNISNSKITIPLVEK